MSEVAIDPTVFNEIKDLMDDAIGSFIGTYLDNSPRLLSGIEQGLNDGDLEAVFGQAHQLRGGSGSIGAMQVFQIANELEERARAGEPEELEGLFKQLQEAYQRAEQELKAYI